MKYSYSLDEEHYTGQYDSVEDAKENGFNDNPDNDSLWIGENLLMTAHNFVNAMNLLESIVENACDECGECAEDWMDDLIKNKEKRSELKALIGNWIEANDPVRFWTVDNVVRINRND